VLFTIKTKPYVKERRMLFITFQKESCMADGTAQMATKWVKGLENKLMLH